MENHKTNHGLLSIECIADDDGNGYDNDDTEHEDEGCPDQ